MKTPTLVCLVLIFAASGRADDKGGLFRPETIDDGIEIGYGLAVADVDGDERTDILLADKREIVWYRAPDWEKSVIARHLTLRDNVCLAARDLDGDGRCELGVGANWNPGETVDENQSGSVHYLEAGEDPTQPWSVVTLPHEPTVHRMHWARTGAKRWSLVVQPLHGRGNVRGEGEPARMFAYHLPKDPSDPENWERELLDASLHQTHNFDVARSPRGFEPMLLAGREGLILVDRRKGARLEIDGTSFEDHQGAGEARFGPAFTHRGSSLLFYTTIEPMHGNEVVIYRAVNGRDGTDGWERRVIDDRLSQGHALACADLLGLGREQVVAGWRRPDAEGNTGINLYAWDPDEDEWFVHPIDSGTMACEDLKVADLDADGKLDIVASGRATGNVIIYWNEAEVPPPPEAETTWKKHEIWTGGRSPAAVAGDFSGDGVTDVAFNAGGRAHLVTGPDWKHQVLSPPGEPSGGIHCAAMDVDSDGDLDYVDCPRLLCWLENPGPDRWSDGPWTWRVIDRDPNGIHCVLPADVNEDGKLDLIANQFNPVGPVADSILWYETPSHPDGEWRRHIFADGDAPGGSHYMGFGDLDGDQRPDIAAGAKGPPFEGGHWFAWWKNPGLEAITDAWEKTIVATDQWCATNILPGDVDGDGDDDLVASRGHGVGVLWFENVRGDGSVWTEREIDPWIANPHCLTVADLDEDGDLDAASCGYADRIAAWYENDGSGDFKVHDLDRDQESYDIRSVDMDGDGDLDLLLAGRGSQNVVYYENPLR